MADKIVTLKDKNGDSLYPMTQYNSVTDANGEALPSDFTKIVEYSSVTSATQGTLLDNYYTKTNSDNRYYNKTEIDNLESLKEDKFDYVTLWTNTDITQSLSTLEYSITNVSQYRGFVLYYTRAKDYDLQYNQTVIVPPLKRSHSTYFNLIGIFGYTVYCRNCYIDYTNNKFIVNTGYKQTAIGSGTTDTDKLIPVSLIGIK